MASAAAHLSDSIVYITNVMHGPSSLWYNITLLLCGFPQNEWQK